MACRIVFAERGKPIGAGGPSNGADDSKPTDLISLKRETYSKAINQVELVASKVARLVGGNDKERTERSDAFWDELVLAYQIQNEQST